MNPNRLLKISIGVLMLAGTAAPSWAWRGGGGWGWGPGVGIYVGPGAYAYPPPDPYYGPYYPPPYAPAPAYYNPNAPYYGAATPAQPAPVVSPDNSRHDLSVITQQLSQLRTRLENDYSDGDISKDQYNARVNALNEIYQQARSEADANGGYITGDQQTALLQELQGRRPATAVASAPAMPVTSPQPAVSSSRRDLTAVNDLLLELRALLDQKLKDAAITQGQHDAEAQSLDRIDAQARSAAAANNGALSSEQENAFLEQLHSAYYAINHNFMTN